MGDVIASSVGNPVGAIVQDERAVGNLDEFLPDALRGLPMVQIHVDASGCCTVSNLRVEDTESLLDWLENHGVAQTECSPQTDGYLTVRWTDLALVQRGERQS
jgi:hypothetical protein